MTRVVFLARLVKEDVTARLRSLPEVDLFVSEDIDEVLRELAGAEVACGGLWFGPAGWARPPDLVRATLTVTAGDTVKMTWSGDLFSNRFTHQIVPASSRGPKRKCTVSSRCEPRSGRTPQP